jgi:protein-tyrosine phosphatase
VAYVDSIERPSKRTSETVAAPSTPRWRLVLSALRARTERALHPWLRWRTRARLKRSPIPASVYFICTGNIYRSPFAAACFVAKLPPGQVANVRVGSGGFMGPDRPAPEEAVAVARNFGVDLSGHRSVVVSGVQIGSEDLIVVMEVRQADVLARTFRVDKRRVVVLGDLDPENIERRSIADPWQQPSGVLAAAYARIERCVHALAEIIARDSITAPLLPAAVVRVPRTPDPDQTAAMR